MKFNHLKIAILIFLIFLIFPTLSFAEKKSVKTIGIIAFGDSLTEGCGVNSTKDFPGASDCLLFCPDGVDCYNYVYALNKLLDHDSRLERDGFEYVTENFGVGGDKTYDGLKRMNEVLYHPCNEGAQYILINFGTNDLAHNRHPDNIAFNLKAMAQKALNHGAGVIPLVATITPDLTPGNTKNIVGTNKLIRKEINSLINGGLNVSLVELHTPLLPNWNDIYTTPRSCYEKFNKNDQLHPNKSGCEAIGQLWYQSLIEKIHPTLSPLSPTWNSLLLEDKKR